MHSVNNTQPKNAQRKQCTAAKCAKKYAVVAGGKQAVKDKQNTMLQNRVGLLRLALYRLDALGKQLLIFAVRLFQVSIGVLLPPSCRYEPSCSKYALQALQQRNCIMACWFIARRLLRCHPWGASGYDPVPVPPAKKTAEI